MLDCLDLSSERVLLKIKVIPNSKKNEIKDIWNGYLKVCISSIPEKGKANVELIKFLAKSFNMKQCDVKIISGELNHLKIVELPTVPNCLK